MKIKKFCQEHFFLSDSILLVFILGIFIFYNYQAHLAPTYFLAIIQLVILWFILRICFSLFPFLIQYTAYIILFVGLIQAIWGLGQLYNYFPSGHALFKTMVRFSILAPMVDFLH